MTDGNLAGDVSPALQQYRDVACTACGCVCDDLCVTVNAERILAIEPPCHLAESWLTQRFADSLHTAWVESQPVELSDGIVAAARLLSASESPLIYGLSSSSTPGQRAAIRLADVIGACIDTTASNCHGPSIVALQQVGESTCSLGEVANRADLVIFWGSDPVSSHPRHLERYALEPKGLFVAGGRADRKLLVVDVQPTETSRLADRFWQISPGTDFEAIWTLRGLLGGLQLSAEGSSLPRDELSTLVQYMKACRCGVIFFGRGLAQGPTGHANIVALLSLVRDLNAFTRFHARRMRVYGDVAGADSVLTWQTGFPFSVNLARGYPRYNPGEYSADALLARQEVDCCLVVGGEGISTLSTPARDYLSQIPTILLDQPAAQPNWQPTIRFNTAIYGIHLPGTAYRMDEIPVPLKAVLKPRWPADVEILQRIQAALSSRKKVR